MKQFHFFLPFVLFCLSACRNSTDKRQQQPHSVAKTYNPCIDGRDTTFHLAFTKDTTTGDFYSLLAFIEKKGEFTRYDKKGKIDSSTGSSLVLQKVLCEEKDFDTPVEMWILDSVFSIRYYMHARKPLRGQDNFFPKFDITQFNFKTEAEKNRAYAKIKEIGWGDPLRKWNDNLPLSLKSRETLPALPATMC